LSRWPGGAPFALFLSHDVDQVHDRGFYRILGDLNHLRRMLVAGEAGVPRACGRRILRSLLHPKDWQGQFENILSLEAAHGWRSTFFFLDGHRGSRYGARYDLEDPRIRELAARLRRAGCEIGVHGGWYDYEDADALRRSAERVERAFGVRPVGIRNHYLRLSVPGTWNVQARAGFRYDSTFGSSDRVGFRDGRRVPFQPEDPETGHPMGIWVLPLAAMDTALFRCMGLRKAEALASLRELLQETERHGGLLSLLWHNNYFDEPEYAEWEETYEEFLAILAERRPWCATGAEICDWLQADAGKDP